MPGGRPRKTRHAGGRPAVYLTNEARQAARKASQEKWYFSSRVHKRVKKAMRARYHKDRAVQEGGASQTSNSVVAEVRTPPSEPAETCALMEARKVQQRFHVYIEFSDEVFLKRTLRLVQSQYTVGEASPLLDDIQDQLNEMASEVEAYLSEVLNIVGAWADEYGEVQAIRDEIKWLLRKITDIQCSAMEGTLEQAL